MTKQDQQAEVRAAAEKLARLTGGRPLDFQRYIINGRTVWQYAHKGQWHVTGNDPNEVITKAAARMDSKE